MQQILVPVVDAPVGRAGRGKAGQGEGGGEDVLAETGVRILGVEGIDQERVLGLRWSAGLIGIERRRGGHLEGNPTFGDWTKERLIGRDHECTLYYKVLHVNERPD